MDSFLDIAPDMKTAIEYSIIEDNDAVIASVVFVELQTGETISVTGSSKRDPIDKYDPVVGVNLALGRAFEKLGKKLQKRANGKMRHNDWVKDARAKLRTAKADVTKATEVTKKERKLLRHTKNK
jgi:hypothetical protein